jgi:DHA2 family methylenomycin A resistance protein-like MFS transporter
VITVPSESVRPLTLKLVGISFAYFMVLLDATVLALADPDIIAKLHTNVIAVGWATTIYTMTLAATLTLGGVLSDRFGAYRVFVFGVAGFGAASLGCAASPDLVALLVGRGFLGIFAAAVIPSSLSLIATLYPERSARARAISVWAAISGAATAAGPILGGWLIATDGRRCVATVRAASCKRSARQVNFMAAAPEPCGYPCRPDTHHYQRGAR